MSVILAIETSTELASVAILSGDRLLSRQSAGAQSHSQNVLPMVQSLLAEAGMTIGRCDAIAFGAGPGSFTGVRTACGIVQGLAFGASLPVVPIVTLEAMAQACREASGADNVLAMLDARMEEVYWAQYRYENGWRIVGEPALSAAAAVERQGIVAACGNGLTAYVQAFDAQAFAQGVYPDIMPHAEQVAQLARIAFENGKALSPQQAQPLYLRNKVALTTAERSARTAA